MVLRNSIKPVRRKKGAAVLYQVTGSPASNEMEEDFFDIENEVNEDF